MKTGKYETTADTVDTSINYTVIAMCGVLFCLKITGGAMGGSKALMLSALGSLLICVASGIAVVDRRFNARQASDNYPYGYGKMELVISAAMSAVIFLGVAAFGAALIHDWLYHRQHPPALSCIWISLGNGVLCLAMHIYGRRGLDQGAKQLINAPLNYLRLDVWLSLLVVLGIFLTAQGWSAVDSVIAVVIAAWIVFRAGALLIKAIRGLLNSSISAEKQKRVTAAVKEIPEIIEICSLRSIQTATKFSISLTVALPATMSITQADQVTERVKQTLRQRFDNLGEVLVGFCTTNSEGE